MTGKPTRAELETLAGLAAGQTMLQVAKARHRGVTTLKTQLAHARKRLGATTTIQLVAICVARGWLPLGDREIYDRPDDEGDTSSTPPPGFAVGAGPARTFLDTHPGSNQ